MKFSIMPDVFYFKKLNKYDSVLIEYFFSSFFLEVNRLIFSNKLNLKYYELIRKIYRESLA